MRFIQNEKVTKTVHHSAWKKWNNILRICAVLAVCTPLLNISGAKAAAIPDNALGVGVSIGNTTGINAKRNFGTLSSLGVSFSRALGQSYNLFATDYTWHLMDGIGASGFLARISPYIGIGLGAKIRDTSAVTGAPDRQRFAALARVPAGLEWNPARVPVGVFGQVMPSFDFYPTFTGQLFGELGGRFYF